MHRLPVGVGQVLIQDNRRILWQLKDVQHYHQNLNQFGKLAIQDRLLPQPDEH